MLSDAELVAAGAQRVERIGDAVLILGDCREIAPKLPKPDAVVSDPPYGQKLNTAVVKTGTRGGSVKGKSNIYPSIIGDDLPFDPTDLCRMADNVLLWGAHKFHARLPDCGRWLFWDKRGGVLPEFTQGCGEMAWHNQAGPVRVCRLIWGGAGDAGWRESGRAGRACSSRAEAGGADGMVPAAGWNQGARLGS